MRTRGFMADPSWRAQQTAELYASHVREINEFIDGIQRPADGLWAPHIAPYYAQSGSPLVLSVLRDPGRGAHHDSGSGFLCMENDDPTSARQRALFGEVGLTADDLIPWNAYPYYIDRVPSGAELNVGARIIVDLLSLERLRSIRVILLQGREAAAMWSRVLRDNPSIEVALGLRVVQTIHPSPNALRTNDPTVREAREASRREAYWLTARVAGRA